MITALELRAGLTVVQPVGVGRTARVALWTVRDVDRVYLRGDEYVHTRVTEDGGYPFGVFWPPLWRIQVVPDDAARVRTEGPHIWAETRKGLVCLRPSCGRPAFPTVSKLRAHYGGHR